MEYRKPHPILALKRPLMTKLPIAATLTAAAAAAWTYAALSRGSQIFGKTLIAGSDPTQIALTFDDGPNDLATERLLEVLARHNVHATFFMIGDFVRQRPAIARAVAAAGHAIGNHTMTHPYLPWQSRAAILDELTGCNRALEDTLGRRVSLFRAPHGARRPAVFRATRALNLQTVQWNLIVQDWEPVPAAIIYTRIASGIARNAARGRGTNVVLHDGGQNSLGEPRLPTVEAVEMLLDQLPSDTVFVVPPRWN